MLDGIDACWVTPPSDWLSAIAERKSKNVAKMAETLAKNPSPMSFQSALNVVRDIVKANPDAVLVNEGATALAFTRSIVDMYTPRKLIDVGTWGIMGIGMGFCVAAAVMWATGSFVSPRTDLPGDPFVSTGWQMLLGGIVCTVAGIAHGEVAGLDVSSFTTDSIIAWVYLVTIGSLVASGWSAAANCSRSKAT